MDNIDVNQRIKDIKPGKVISRIIIGVFVAMFVFGAFGTIGAGERGCFFSLEQFKIKYLVRGSILKYRLSRK